MIFESDRPNSVKSVRLYAPRQPTSVVLPVLERIGSHVAVFNTHYSESESEVDITENSPYVDILLRMKDEGLQHYVGPYVEKIFPDLRTFLTLEDDVGCVILDLWFYVVEKIEFSAVQSL